MENDVSLSEGSTTVTKILKKSMNMNEKNQKISPGMNEKNQKISPGDRHHLPCAGRGSTV
jgi:hypothetical protein